MKILFITSNRVGDAVLSTGTLAALVEHYPGAQFTVACGPYAAGLFRAVPHLEKLIVIEKRTWNRHWISLWVQCIGTRWDLIVDLRNSLAARLLRTKQRFHGAHRLGKHKVIENAALLGLNPPPAPKIWLDAQAEREAAQILPATRPLLALGPAANWPCKQWPVERFAELAQKLISEGGPLAGGAVVVLADTHEREQLKPLLETVKCIEVMGKSLLTAAAVLKQCRLFVGNDSGLMHVAAAMGTPTLGLFGPGYEEIYGPWGPRAAYVRTPESREELLSRIPDTSAREPNLMLGLTVEKTFDAAKALLAKT